MTTVRILIFSCLLVSLFSCGKYEDGGFSLRTKKGRITNTWKIEKATFNSYDLTDTLNTFLIKFDKNDRVTLTSFDPLISSDTITMTGAWELDKDEVTIIMVFTSLTGSAVDGRIWKILRLKSDEMWVREILSNGLIEYYFVPK